MKHFLDGIVAKYFSHSHKRLTRLLFRISFDQIRKSDLTFFQNFSIFDIIGVWNEKAELL